MNVQASSAEERKQARRKQTAERRAMFFRARLEEAAGNPKTQLGHACAYVRAIGDDLAPGQVVGLAREVAELADRWHAK